MDDILAQSNKMLGTLIFFDNNGIQNVFDDIYLKSFESKKFMLIDNIFDSRAF